MASNSVPKRVQSLPSRLNLFLSKYSLFMAMADRVDIGSKLRNLESGPGNGESEQFGLEEQSEKVL